MIDEERVKIMTKIALKDKRHHRALEIAEEYTPKDYLSMRILRSWVLGTIFYLIVYALIVIFVFYKYILTIHVSNILIALFLGLLFYVIFLFLYLRGSGRRAAKTYRKAKEHYKSYKELKDELMESYGLKNQNTGKASTKAETKTETRK